MAAMQLTRTHRVLIGVVVAGALIIAAIGFAGSYAAVRELAESKGFGAFSVVFPIGIDAGICVLLALDLLLTWMRIPFPLLRQTAWLLTAATIAFNGAAAWPDPLGVGMHAVIPVLFVVAVEAARHAVGRIADITADRHMEGVRLTRWLLSPVPTFRLWRRMKLWELRSYEQVIKLEQDRLIYQARLQARFGRAWRRKAPVEALMPLRLAKYGVPLAETAPAGLAAAGIEPALLPPAPVTTQAGQPELPTGAGRRPGPREAIAGEPAALPVEEPHDEQQARDEEGPRAPGAYESPWFAASQAAQDAYQGTYDPTYAEGFEPVPVPVPAGPGGRTRPLGQGPDPQAFDQPYAQEYEEQYAQPVPEAVAEAVAEFTPEDKEFEELAYPAYKDYVDEHQVYPNARTLDILLADRYGVRHPNSTALLKRLMPGLQKRHQADLEAEHIA
ncbi:DUF2637 domain-containing protein [Streptomyces sp. PKU-EA00015]|uniref:DUF2637 domain-containing protein n=1 Tax=Streptomyces sp. PKU-EA00015 TaxID=2748326 RepID=UPI00159F7480|nr:DUF2637 domain-containing protein [Streptomyces sp. PKU-EA00015]NWF25925.1 DUF2637 domain-containing protein [Streptomyces sp. PKU-EA00015]